MESPSYYDSNSLTDAFYVKLNGELSPHYFVRNDHGVRARFTNITKVMMDINLVSRKNES